MNKKINEDYRFRVSHEDVIEMMADNAPAGSSGNEVILPWELYDENREMMDDLFHIEFEDGDKAETQVRVMSNTTERHDDLDNKANGIVRRNIGMDEGSLDEGGIPGEETRAGEDYIQYVQGALHDLIDAHGLSLNIESLIDDNLEIIIEFMGDREEPNDAAEFILKGAIGPEQWNIINHHTGANMYE